MLLVGFVFVVLTYLARTFRWQALLVPLGPVRFSTTLRATIVGFAALGLLPARAGDLLRPYMGAREEGLSGPATFAPGVLERVVGLGAGLGGVALVWGGVGGA